MTLHCSVFKPQEQYMKSLYSSLLIRSYKVVMSSNDDDDNDNDDDNNNNNNNNSISNKQCDYDNNDFGVVK